MKIQFEDHSAEVLAVLDAAAGRAVEGCGLVTDCLLFWHFILHVCSKACSYKAKERRNKRSYALSFGAEDGT